MKWWNRLFKNKPVNEYQSISAVIERSKGYELFTPELLQWISSCTDAEKLASAYCLINTYDWPNYLPKPKEEYDLYSGGWNQTPDGKHNYKSIGFTTALMDMLEKKAEMLSPGLKQAVWMSKSYKQYSTRSEMEAKS